VQFGEHTGRRSLLSGSHRGTEQRVRAARTGSRKRCENEEQYGELQDRYPGLFEAGMGAEAIKELLARVDVDTLARELRESMRSETSQQKRLKFAKRLKVVDAFRK